jgi:hypothetical protein
MSLMATHLNQLTLRGLDPRILAEIERVAKANDISLNKAALSLLKRGAGIGDPRDTPNRIGNSLDRFIGTWTAEQASAFSRSLESLEKVDEGFWK